MTGYRAIIRSPEGYPHARAFEELELGFNAALRDLSAYDADGREIVFGAHLPRIFVPPDAIIFNTEVHASGWFTDDYRNLLRRHEVWDYSPANVRWLEQQDIYARHCPIGYHKALERIQPAAQQDIDVLFYGSMTPRRGPIWDAICATGLECVHLFGVYGHERDDYIARSKIVLNIHAYEQSPEETVRLSYLWANQVFVLNDSTEFDIILPQACEIYAKDDMARHVFANANYRIFKKQPQADILAELIAPEKVAA